MVCASLKDRESFEILKKSISSHACIDSALTIFSVLLSMEFAYITDRRAEKSADGKSLFTVSQ